MFWGKPNALDDPVVAAWDAIQRGDRAIPQDFDATEAAMIASFLASDALPAPPNCFVESLGQRFSDLGPHEHAATGRQRIGTSRTTGKEPRLFPWRPVHGRDVSRKPGWGFAPAALALVFALALAGLLVAYWSDPRPSEPPAIPAAVVTPPTMEPFLQFDFDPPMWGMPEATTWTHLDFSVISLETGKSFDTNQGWYTSTDGPLLLYILGGELTIQPNGPSLLYHDGMQGQPPVAVDPGQSIALGPGDGIAYSIHDTATASNSGQETMHALIGLAGSEDFTVPGAYLKPIDVRRDLFQYIDGMTEPLTAGAHVSLQQLELQPYDAYVFDDVENTRILMLAPEPSSLYWYGGAFDTAPAGASRTRISRQTVLSYLGTGPYTLVNIGPDSAVLYLLVLEPAV